MPRTGAYSFLWERLKTEHKLRLGVPEVFKSRVKRAITKYKDEDRKFKKENSCYGPRLRFNTTVNNELHIELVYSNCPREMYEQVLNALEAPTTLLQVPITDELEE